MADDAQVVGGAAGRGVITIAARGHQGLRAEIGELGLVASAQELDYRGMVAGGRECAGFCDAGRRLDEALIAGLIFGHWSSLSSLEAHRPLQQRVRDLVLREMRQRVRERLLVEQLVRREMGPRVARVWAV